MAKDFDYQASYGEKTPEIPKNFEDVLEKIGGFGRFQVMILLFVLFYEIPCGLLAFVPVFVGTMPSKWECQMDEEITELSASQICSECPNGTLSSPFTHHSIVPEWGLICDSSWVVSTLTSVQMFGMLFGNIIPPQISDWYGRKITFLLLIITMVIGQFLSAVAENPYVFGVGRLLCGAGLAGYFSLNGIYCVEFLTPKWRQLAGCLGPLGEGVMLLGLLAYLIKPWRLLIWATTFPLVTIVFIFPFLPESPRWLLRQNRVKEAEGILRYMASINGVRLRKSELSLKHIAAQEDQGADTRYSYLDLFRLKEIRGRTCIFIGIWFCWALTYFGLSYNIKNFGVDPYLLMVLMGVADAVGFRAALLVNNRLGRRKALVLFTGLSALFFLPTATVMLISPSLSQDYQVALISFILLGKLCVAGSRSAVRVLTVESYPVSIRTMGFGVSRVSASFGGFAAPQIAYIGSKWPSIPLFVFGSLGFLGSLFSLLLQETSGKPLQDSMNDSNASKNKVEPTAEPPIQNGFSHKPPPEKYAKSRKYLQEDLNHNPIYYSRSRAISI